VRTELEIAEFKEKKVESQHPNLLKQWILPEDFQKEDDKIVEKILARDQNDLNRRCAALLGPLVGRKAPRLLRVFIAKELCKPLPPDDINDKNCYRWEDRFYVARGMKGLGSDTSSQLLPVLFQLLSDQNTEVRKEAGKTLRYLVAGNENEEETEEKETNAPYYTNLIVNPSGENGRDGWNCVDGGDGFLIFDEGFKTSFEWCVKDQTVDLLANGFTKDQLQCQPPILIQDWVWAGNYGEKEYQITVELCDIDNQVLDTFNLSPCRFPKIKSNFLWEPVTHVFKNYGQKLHHIKFFHGSKDTIYWKGHYGGWLRESTVAVLQ